MFFGTLSVQPFVSAAWPAEPATRDSLMLGSGDPNAIRSAASESVATLHRHARANPPRAVAASKQASDAAQIHAPRPPTLSA